MNPTSQSRGVLALIITAFLWSTAGLFIKTINWHPFAIAGMRSLIASFVILAYIRRPKFTFSFAQVGAGVANAITMILFITANKMTTAANAILLQYIAPLITAILGIWILKEKPKKKHWIAFICVAIGMALIFFDKIGGGTMAGNLIALAAGVSFSFFFILMRKQKSGSPIESVLLAHWFAAFIGLGLSLFYPAPIFSSSALLSIFALGIVQIGFAAIFFSYGIKHVSAVTANIITVIEPVFNPIWVFLILHERPSLNVIIGGVIILSSITFLALHQRVSPSSPYSKPDSDQ